MQQNNTHHTPHISTALTGPLHLLEKQILCEQQEIEKWFQNQWQLSPAPVYGSVDLRNSGFKLAPIDMNLFPAGFNNLNREFLPLSIEAAKHAITQFSSKAKRILLIPENHTRNLFYWENIKGLLNLLKEAEFDVRIGTLLSGAPTITLTNGDTIKTESLVRHDDTIGVADFIPDVVLLNNDLSEG
ncbi:MAG TPA: glutamate--cysteine ligase, partial [Gammaproteobacteria bacterium]|nr:glutamate--cysteine ligase [Gammaproteobacteria bacterium]